MLVCFPESTPTEKAAHPTSTERAEGAEKTTRGKRAADVIGGRGPNGGFDLLSLATVRDAAFISRTVISSWQGAYRDFLPWSFLASLDQNPHHDRQAWESRIRQPASVTWIISDTRNDVGVLRIITGASAIPGTDSELTTLYLLRQARGHGLGSEALALARAEAARRARPILGVCVLAGNKAGQAFYERRGARRIGERVAFRLDQEPIIDILYRFGSIVVSPLLSNRITTAAPG